MNDANDYSNVSTETLRAWIREFETEVGIRPLFSRERDGAQRLLDKYCAELGRRGEN